jgi:hypothetical protein
MLWHPVGVLPVHRSRYSVRHQLDQREERRGSAQVLRASAKRDAFVHQTTRYTGRQPKSTYNAAGLQTGNGEGRRGAYPASMQKWSSSWGGMLQTFGRWSMVASSSPAYLAKQSCQERRCPKELMHWDAAHSSQQSQRHTLVTTIRSTSPCGCRSTSAHLRRPRMR